MALTRAKLEELIAAGEIEVGGGGVNPNLLHNWDFRNPVNQRGVSGTISTGTYFYDRWIRNGGSITINTGYLSVNGRMDQAIEGISLAGKTCTISVLLDDGTIVSSTNDFPTSGGNTSNNVSIGSFVWGHSSDGTLMYIHINTASAVNIVAVKLELGTVSTLHLDPPMDWAVELVKCQRFFVNAGYRPPMYASTYATAGAAVVIFPIGIPMRITPTLNSSNVEIYAGGSVYTGTAVPYQMNGNNLYLNGTISGMPARTPGGARFTAASDIYFSADL